MGKCQSNYGEVDRSSPAGKAKVERHSHQEKDVRETVQTWAASIHTIFYDADLARKKQRCAAVYYVNSPSAISVFP